MFAPALRDARTMAQVRDVLRRVGRVHIPSALTEASAKSLHGAMMGTQWRVVLNGGEKAYDLSAADVDALSLDQRRQLMSLVHKEASAGFQFMFDSYRISDEVESGSLREGAFVDFYGALNSEDGLSLLRAVTGDDRISYADAQATRYGSGHFLTEHNDDVEGKNRLFAYVLNLTTTWRPDWGGLLMFTAPDGHIAEAYTPSWNALNIFRVPQPHSVSYVTPFAAAPRLSITGWLRSARP